MDKLSIFAKEGTEAKLNTLIEKEDEVIDELILAREENEAFVYGKDEEDLEEEKDD